MTGICLSSHRLAPSLPSKPDYPNYICEISFTPGSVRVPGWKPSSPCLYRLFSSQTRTSPSCLTSRSIELLILLSNIYICRVYSSVAPLPTHHHHHWYELLRSFLSWFYMILSFLPINSLLLETLEFQVAKGSLIGPLLIKLKVYTLHRPRHSHTHRWHRHRHSHILYPNWMIGLICA